MGASGGGVVGPAVVFGVVGGDLAPFRGDCGDFVRRRLFWPPHGHGVTGRSTLVRPPFFGARPSKRPSLDPHESPRSQAPNSSQCPHSLKFLWCLRSLLPHPGPPSCVDSFHTPVRLLSGSFNSAHICTVVFVRHLYTSMLQYHNGHLLIPFLINLIVPSGMGAVL